MVRSFKQFLNERQYYHTVRHKDDLLSVGHRHRKVDAENHEHDNPIWLAHNKHDAMDNHLEYSAVTRNDSPFWGTDENLSPKHPSTYRMKVRGKIAHHRDPKIKQLFDKHNINQYSYHSSLNGDFHDTYHIKTHAATKMLQNHGYVGYHHPEEGYQNIPKRPTGSTIVFSRKNVSVHSKDPVANFATRYRRRVEIGHGIKPTRFLTKREKNMIGEKVNYHIARGGSDPMRHKNHPIWLAHDKKLKTGIHGWYSSDKDRNKKNPDVYRAKIKGKIMHHNDPKMEEIARGFPLGDYHAKLNTGKSDDILDHPITKALKRRGYVGYKHPEMSTGALPVIVDHGHESTIVFDRKHVSLKKHEKSKSIEDARLHRSNNPEKYSNRPWDVNRNKDITHTYPIHKRMVYRKHNMKVIKDFHDNIHTVKKDTDENHSINDEPSIITHDGTKYWHKNGKIHRDDDKPAIVAPGIKHYYKNGEMYTPKNLPKPDVEGTIKSVGAKLKNK